MKRAVGVALLLVLNFPRPAFAAWPTDPTVNVPIALGLCSVEDVQIETDGVGGAIIAWEDCRNGQADIYAHHVRFDGTVDPAWPVSGRVVAAFFGTQRSPTIVSDGLGGAIIAWEDFRSGQYAVYTQHVRADGTIDPAWPVTGLPVRLTPGIFIQCPPDMIPDGTGGAIICFPDIVNGHWEMVVHHVVVGGSLDPSWPPRGRSLGTAAALTTEPGPTARIISDGVGGAIVAWLDHGDGDDLDLLAQRVRAIGILDPSWPITGRPLSTTAGSPYEPSIESDGNGGAIVAWTEDQSGAGWDLYATRLQASGALDPQWPVN